MPLSVGEQAPWQARQAVRFKILESESQSKVLMCEISYQKEVTLKAGRWLINIKNSSSFGYIIIALPSFF